MTYSKRIELDYDSAGNAGIIREEKLTPETPVLDYEPFALLREAEVGGRKVNLNLLEAAMMKPDAANLLRSDIRYLAFSAFGQMPESFGGFVRREMSNKPEEAYLRDAAMGIIPAAPSGTEAPEIGTSFEGDARIKNYLHRAIVSFDMDMFRFDQLGKIRQLAFEMGRAAAMTKEDAVYKYITTTSNYGRNSTTNDNDIGANQQTLTWSADGLRTALAIINTAKDRKSGNYLMYNADTLIIGPLMEVPALQLLTTTALSRSHGATTAEAIGTGAINILGNGRIRNIIISPWFSNSYAWALCDSGAMGLMYQEVEPFNVYQETQNVTSESWLTMDAIRYLVKGYFGVGFVDDRAWFYSDSTTDATVS